ncbi:MAG TPA: META domain-containing protein, partial [Methanomicrobiales archaeon]|nr:META domain-containing protein [Methanomicrobiales archaeon]
SGSSGCNQYSGGYVLTGPSIAVGPLATTRMACADAVMNQENTYLDILQKAETWAVAGSPATLTIQDNSSVKSRLVYAKAG